MIELREISKEVFEEHLSNHKNQHFLQTIDVGYRRSLEGWDTQLLGFFKEDNLIGAIQMNNIPVFLNKKKYEIIMGPLLDYQNDKQTGEALQVLKKYMDKIKAIECEISPNLAVAIHYPSYEELVNKEELIKLFEKNHWMLLKGTDDLVSKLKWFFKKDLSQFKSATELFNSYDRETKRLIGNAKTFPLKVVELDIDNLGRAIDILDETGKRREFLTRGQEYHKSLYEYMNKNHEAKYLVVELDVQAYLESLEQEVKQIKQDILKDAGNKSKRARNRVNQNKDQLEAREKRIDQLKQINKKTVDICSGVFIGANNTMTYLFGGSKKEFMQYYGSYFLQDYSINYAFQQGYKIYDFYGTRSSISGFPEEDGVFDFKKGFGGNLYENIGHFKYQPKNLTSFLVETLRKLKHAISK